MPAKRPDISTKYDPFGTAPSLRKQNQDVRVGYIDPKRGFIDGLTVYQANKYAEKNPGTQFIHRNRDRIAYLNINSVNKLTNENTKPKKGSYSLVDKEGNYDPCNTIKGLTTNPSGEELPNKPGEGSAPFTPVVDSGTGKKGKAGGEDAKQDPIVIVEGGGGVGCVGKPIIGKDGAIIHIRVVHGGFGYRFPPQVRIIDPNKKGAGATAVSALGERALTLEEFGSSSDFEDYDFELPPLAFDALDNAYGSSYSLSSNTVIGDWDPRKVLSLTAATGFEQELQKYLEFLKGFDPNKPWWSTRNEEPVKVVRSDEEKSNKKASKILFPVEHIAWGGEKEVSKDFIDVQFEVYGQGTRGNRSIFYNFVAKDGSHKFKVKGVTHEERSGKTRVTRIFKVKANTTYDVTASVISGRGARSEVVEQGLLEKAGRGAAENRKFQEEQRSSTIFGDIIGSLNDNDDIQITAKRGKFKASNRRIVSVDATDAQKEKFKSEPNRFRRATFDLTYRVNVPGATTVTRTILPSFMNSHAICPTLPSNKIGSDMHGKLYTMVWKEQFPHKGVYTFRGICDDNASVYIDSEKIMTLPGHKGVDKKSFSPLVKKFEVDEGLHEIRIDLLNSTMYKTVEKIISARGGGKTKQRVPVDFEVYGEGTRRNTDIKFVFTALNGTDTFTIRPKKDRPEIGVEYNYTRTVEILPNTDYKVVAVAGSTIPSKFAKRKTYTIEYEGLNKSNTPIDASPNKLRFKDGHANDVNASFKIKSTSPGVKARFSGDGKELIVFGDGEVSLTLEWDDNPKVAGRALRKINLRGKDWRQTGERGKVTQTIKVGSSTSSVPPTGRRNITKRVPIKFNNLNPRNNPLHVSNIGHKLYLKDNHGKDVNAEVIIEDVKGGTARFSQDGRSLVCNGSVEVRITLDWDDNPNVAGKALDSFEIGGKVWRQVGERGVKTQTIKIDATEKEISTEEVKLTPEQGCLKERYFGKGGKGIENNKPSTVIFADIIGSANDNDDIQIRCGNGIFTPSNKRKISGVSGQGRQTRNTYDLNFRYDVNPEVDGRIKSVNRQLRKGGYSTNSEIQEVTVFNTNEYINRANRKLYRVFPSANQTQDFFGQNAVTPFNPLELDPDFPKITKPRPEKPRKPKVNFEQDGKNLKMKVTGSGKVKIGFKVNIDDNPNKKGLALKEVRIDSDEGAVSIKRGRIGDSGRYDRGRWREIDKKFGEGTFTAGKEYNIKVIGGSSTSGFKTVDKTKVFFDDDIDNGFDNNGVLKVSYIKVIEESRSTGPNIEPLPNGAANKLPSKPYKGDTNDYAGTHTIRWNNVRFPVTGNYKIGVMVDDNVRIEIGTKQKGNVVNLYKKGFSSPGKSTGKSEYIENIPEGNYTITAYLQQIPGRPINNGNPMGLAIDITSVFATVEERIVNPQSWYQNPYGVALTIHAPLPPVPNPDITQEEGPCPQNPIWTTRHNQASGQERWIPCNHRAPSGRRTWSRFMNAYALSPILPLSTPRSGRPGETWDTKWDVEIPYDGFYNFQGTVDNKATVSIGTHFISKLDHFGTEKKDLTDNKIFLRKGKVTVDMSVTQGELKRPVVVEKKCFNTADWAVKPSQKPDRIGVDFSVYGQGSKKNMGLKFVFQEIGAEAPHTFTIDNVNNSGDVESIKKRVKRNTDYKVTAIATGTHTIKNQERRYPIRTEGESRTAGRILKNNKLIQFDDDISNGFDENASLKIESTSPGVNAKFSDDAKELIVKGEGEVTLKFKWDDNPKTKGLAVGTLKIGRGDRVSATFRQRGEKGEERQTIRAGGSTNKGATRKNITKSFPITYRELNPKNNPINVSGNGKVIKLKDGSGSDTNAKMTITDVKGGTAKFSPDGRSLICNGSVDVTIDFAVDDDPGTAGIALRSFTIGNRSWLYTRNGGRGETENVKLDATQAVPAPPEEVKLVPEQGTLKRGSFGSSKAGGAKESPNQSDVIFADVIGSLNDNDDMQIRCARGIFTPSNKRTGVTGTSGQGTQKRNTWDLTFRVDAAEEGVETIEEINGVNYIGPTRLASYRKGNLGNLLSPFFPLGEDQGGDLLNGKSWVMEWENVDFPETGNYNFLFEVDDSINVEISNEESKSKRLTFKSIGTITLNDVRNNGNKPFKLQSIIPKGKRNVRVTLTNLDFNNTFRRNPTYFGMRVKFKDTILGEDVRSWRVNPVGVSAVLIAPPCPRNIGGIGIVSKITPTNPGNGYTTSSAETVPGVVKLTDVEIDTPGIGYTSGDSAIIGGREFPITTGEFGKIISVGIGIGTGPDGGGIPITAYPDIDISTSTGTNFRGIPVTDLVVDPVDVDPEDLIQITDLAGLKQNGYIQGRPYYGEVYYENGVPFAGRYKTAGQAIQVYATLQESIDGEVTTRPSAIQRSGTDINSNNPRLNIPGTPDNLV